MPLASQQSYGLFSGGGVSLGSWCKKRPLIGKNRCYTQGIGVKQRATCRFGRLQFASEDAHARFLSTSSGGIDGMWRR